MLVQLDDSPRGPAMCSIVTVYAVLFVEAWVLSDMLDVDGGLRCECGTSIGTAGEANSTWHWSREQS